MTVDPATRSIYVDPALADVAAGRSELARGAKSTAVERMQEALVASGYQLKPVPQKEKGYARTGIDGNFGANTEAAVKKFQIDHGLPATGRLDRATVGLLSMEAEKYPEYDKLYADGKLETTIAIGYDEGNSHLAEIRDVNEGLRAQGYTEIDPKTATADQLRAAGIEPAKVDKEVRYFTKTFQYKGKDIKSVVTLITPSTPNAKDKFARAVANSEVVLYGGHGRYGSGPDFDNISSTTGNFVIGNPYAPGHVTLPAGRTSLQQTQMTNNYQFMVFTGCTTHHYVDDLRRQPGKNTENLDLMVTNKVLYWNNVSESVLTPLDGLTNGQSVNQIESRLEVINQDTGEPDKWQSNGFGDN